MKKINLLMLILFATLPVFAWGETYFTSLATLDDQFVYGGVKEVRPGMMMNSYLLEVDSSKMTSQKVDLPEEIENREVVALLAATRHQLVVVTQITQGGGDKPRVHLYNIIKKSWKKVSDIDCISFSKLKLHRISLEFYCEEVDAKGNSKVVGKKVSFPVDIFSDKKEVLLPVKKVQEKSLTASLEGEDFEWEKLKVIRGSAEKIFAP